MNNIIILTHGWTGSSVFAGLFGEVGYWLGADTVRKADYNTFENADLVSLNNVLLRTLMPTLNHEHRFAAKDVAEIERRARDLDLQPRQDFVDQCAKHSPWLWKDPRLTWTIRVWSRVLELERTSFLVLTREHTQAWISANTRRHVQSLQFTRSYNGGITRSNLRFLEEHGLPCLQSSFEDLLLAPERTLDRLNEFFGINLTIAHLRAVCHEPLGRKSRDWKDFVVASLIYFKNIRERDFRARKQVGGA
jgi:hypothetical protein